MFVLMIVLIGVVLALAGTLLSGRKPEDPDDHDPLIPVVPEGLDRLRGRGVPAVTGVLGAALLLAGVAGATGELRTAPEATRIVAAGAAPEEPSEPTPHPVLIEVALPTPEPTPEPTPAPTPPPTPAATPATAPAPAPATLTVEASPSCDASTLRIRYTLRAPEGRTLTFYTLYLDGSVARGGSISGSEHSGSYETSPSPGAREFEIVVTDSGDAKQVRRYQVTCR